MRVCRASSFQFILKLFLTFEKSKHTIEEFWIGLSSQTSRANNILVTIRDMPNCEVVIIMFWIMLTNNVYQVFICSERYTNHTDIAIENCS